jgi:hypothetical protein
MFISTTPQLLIDDINALTDNDGYSLVSAAQLCSWINNELTSAWAWIGRSNRDVITKCTAQFSVTSAQATGGLSMVAAAPALALTDFSYPRGVDILVTADTWKPIRKWSFTTRNMIYSLSYRFIGDTMYIQPSDQATSYPYRVWYIFKAPAVVSTSLSTALSIPDGLDEYIKQGVAAKMRIRLDDDPAPHLQAQGISKQEIKAWLRTNSGDQSVIADVDREGIYY